MEIKEISTAALKEKIEADEELYLIDVREDEEFSFKAAVLISFISKENTPIHSDHVQYIKVS